MLHPAEEHLVRQADPCSTVMRGLLFLVRVHRWGHFTACGVTEGFLEEVAPNQ